MTATLGDGAVVELPGDFSGTLVTPADNAYEGARRTWNWSVDCRPDAIAICRSAADVQACLAYARDAGIHPAVRAGGHSYPGFSTCDGGLLIDLSGMRRISVDAGSRVARVEGGATWADFDSAAHQHGLATTGGLISSTGVAGLTLGGGIGWLMRRWGLACDNLISAQVVTPDGAVVRASSGENPDLFWGLRGGGGNFGIVTEFEFALHPVSDVVGGLMLFPVERAHEVVTFFRDWTRRLPDELSTLLVFLTAPPLPFVPEALHFKPAVAIAGCHSGDQAAAMAELEPLRQLGPAADVFGPLPYPALQSMMDEGAPPGLLNYLKSGYLDALSDGAVTALIDAAARRTSPLSAVHVHQMGGAVARVGEDETAYSNRSAEFVFNVVVAATEPAAYEADRVWAREAASALAAYGHGGAYVNFIAEADAGAARDAYGSKYARLAEIKRRYDPANLLRHNQNIAP